MSATVTSSITPIDTVRIPDEPVLDQAVLEQAVLEQAVLDQAVVGQPALDGPALVRVEAALLRIIRSVFKPTLPMQAGIDRAGYIALARLESCGALRLSDLAAQLELDLSTVSRQVKVLEGIGLVQRAADPADGRAAVVSLSKAGSAELARQRDRRFQTLNAAFAQMPARDRDRLVHLLDQLAGSIAPVDGCSKTTERASR